MLEVRVDGFALLLVDQLHQRTEMANPGRGAPTLTFVTGGGPFDLATRTYLEPFVIRAIPGD